MKDRTSTGGWPLNKYIYKKKKKLYGFLTSLFPVLNLSGHIKGSGEELAVKEANTCFIRVNYILNGKAITTRQMKFSRSKLILEI